MKVLLTSDWYPPVVNGVVTSVLTLRQQLEARGHDVHMLTLAPQGKSTQDEFGYRLASVGAGAIYADARVGIPPSRRFLDEILEWGPDVVHSQAEFSTFAWARRVAADASAPLVHTYHTMYEDYTHYFSPSKRLGRFVAARLSRAILARTDHVIAPTQKVADLLTSYRVEVPVHVVPTGTNVDALRPAASDPTLALERERIRSTLGVRPQDMLLIYVGRLAREKELDRIMDLLARYRKEQGSRPRRSADQALPRLLVVGDGPERAALEKHARSLDLGDVVHFAGAVPREEVGRWYVAGDVFVSASRSETQGLTYGEALACGVPVIGAADPCLDKLAASGRGCWQYANDDEFLRLLRMLAENPMLRAQAAEHAREIAVLECSSETFGRRIEAVYQQALRDKPRRHTGTPRHLEQRKRDELVGSASALIAGSRADVTWGRM